MLVGASRHRPDAHMWARSISIPAVVCLVFFSSSCMNIGLLEQLENPGKSSSSCGNDCRIFVTANTYNGNSGGPAGADARCMNDSGRPNSATRWKAMVVASGARTACTSSSCGTGGAAENLNWVMKPNATYRRPDGSIYALTNGSAIFSFPLAAGIGPTAAGIWTGLAGDWTQSSNCLGWTVDDSTLGAVGEGGSNSATVINWTNSACSSGQLLYCVEQ